MNKILRVSEVFLIFLILISVNTHRLYDGSGLRADIFIFYDYEGGRMLSNILYEFGMHISRIGVSIILMLRTRNLIFECLMLYFIVDYLGYLLFFGQGVNLYTISIVLIYYIWKKTRLKNG